MRQVLLRVLAIVAFAALGLGVAQSAAAHTGLDSSVPAADTTTTVVVDAVTLTFTEAVTELADGFSAFDGDGTVRTPSQVERPDDTTVVLRFDPPLSNGDVGIRWAVTSADGHVVDDAFAFTVDAALPPVADEIAPAQPTAPADSPAEPVESTPEEAETPAASTPGDDVDEQFAADAAAMGHTADEHAEHLAFVEAEIAAERARQAQSLDEFLDTETASQPVAASFARAVSFPALAVAVGGVIALALVVRGPRSELDAVRTLVVIAAAVVVVASAIEYVASVSAVGDSIATAFTSGTDRSFALRIVGGALLAAAVVGSRHVPLAVRPARSVSAAVAVADAATVERTDRTADTATWQPRSAVLLVGAIVLLVGSFAFDGHTTTTGWWALHAVVTMVHVAAGSIWAGGVVVLAVLALLRRRDERTIAPLVARFSRLATVSLIAVAVAGTAMTVTVLDSVDALWTTSWGRVIAVKSLAVAIAAGLGAHHHLKVRAGATALMRTRLRATLAVEAVALVAAAVVP